MKIHTSKGHATRSRAGFTLIEVSLAVTILIVAVMATSASTASMSGLRRQNRERSVAHNMIRTISENVHSISDVALANPATWAATVTAAASPGGEIGDQFDVRALTPIAGQNRVGTLQVITDETLTDADLDMQLGMPRDLNGDGDAADTDVSANARLLPVIVTVRWRGVSGDQVIRHPFYVIGY